MGTFIVAAALVAALGGIIAYILRQKKKGQSCGCGSCEGCSGCNHKTNE